MQGLDDEVWGLKNEVDGLHTLVNLLHTMIGDERDIRRGRRTAFDELDQRLHLVERSLDDAHNTAAIHHQNLDALQRDLGGLHAKVDGLAGHQQYQGDTLASYASVTGQGQIRLENTLYELTRRLDALAADIENRLDACEQHIEHLTGGTL